ncbi:hypothetical protein ACYZTR_02390 [Pseudomonas sp. Hz4]
MESINFFGVVVSISDPPISVDPESLVSYKKQNYQVRNAADTAEEPASFKDKDYINSKYRPKTRTQRVVVNGADNSYEVPFGETEVFDINANSIIIVNCPDKVQKNWFLLDGSFLSPQAFAYWNQNLLPKGLPPRSAEELEADRIASLYPEQVETLAVVRMSDTFSNFQVATFALDINNTTVEQLRSALTPKLGAQPKNTPMASTDAFTPDEVVKRFRDSWKNTAVAFDSINRFCSVLDGKKRGQNPPVGVAGNHRLTLTDDLRLAQVLGRVIVYVHPQPIPRESFLSQLKEKGIDALIDIVSG